MARFIPRQIKTNVNVSGRPLAKELCILIGGVAGGILLVYIALGFLVDIIVPHIPPEVERNLSISFAKVYESKDPRMSNVEAKVKKLLDEMIEFLPSSDYKYPYNVSVIQSDRVNALALPGGKIIIFSGLLKEIKYENELAFVLGHELGHFTHRDHLKGLGRGLVFFLISSFLLGPNNDATQFFQSLLTNTEMKFSQTQEIAADLFSLSLLNAKYGSVSGGVEFMKRLQEEEKLPRFLYFFATHPHPEERIKKIKEMAAKRGYTFKKMIPLDDEIKKTLSSSGEKK